MLIREQPATELAVATRILARAGALPDDGRITVRLHDVVYVAARGVSNHTMTPYDVVSLLIADGSRLIGDPPEDIGDYVAVHRGSPAAVSVVRAANGDLLSGPSIRACTIAALRAGRGTSLERNDDATIERTWLELVSEARIAGALIGAFPTDDDA